MILTGDVPSAMRPPPGCRFNTRCPYAQERCRTEEPVLREAGPGHRVACHFYESIPTPAGVAVTAVDAKGNFAVRLDAFERAMKERSAEPA